MSAYRIIGKTIIAGKEWTIVRTSDLGGWFDSNILTIGIGHSNKADMLDTLMHEILEAVLFERGYRYKLYDEGNEKMLFSFNHAEFDNIACDMVLALKPFLKNINFNRKYGYKNRKKRINNSVKS